MRKNVKRLRYLARQTARSASPNIMDKMSYEAAKALAESDQANLVPGLVKTRS